MVTELIIKKWGNSMGVILPKSLIEKESLKENDAVAIEVIKKADFSEIFGTLKRKVSGQKFKDIARKGWKD